MSFRGSQLQVSEEVSERSDDLALEERGLDILSSVTVLRGSSCCIRDLAVACTAGMSGLSCQMETFRCAGELRAYVTI